LSAAGSASLENPSDLPGDQAIRIRQAKSVAEQPARRGELANIVHCGQCTPRRECDQLLAPKEEKRLDGNEDRAGPRLDESFEGDVKVVLSAGLYDENLFSNVAGRRLQLSYFEVGPWVIRVCQQADQP
jgi:hypothetical protein